MRQLLDSLDFNIALVAAPPSAPATVLCANAAVCALLGYRAEELAGAPLSRLVNSAYHDALAAWVAAQTGNGAASHPAPFECLLADKRGGAIAASLSLSPWHGTGTPPHSHALLLQTLGNAPLALQTWQAMRLAIEQSASAVAITDQHGRIEYVNPKFLQLSGFGAEELPGKNLRTLQAGTVSTERYRRIWQALRESGHWHGEIEQRRKDGSYFWAQHSVTAIKDDADQIVRILSVTEDVSARKQVESALLESEERFRQMAEMTGEWLWEQNPEGYYIYCSAAVEEILGYTPEQVIGKHYTELLTPQDKALLQPNTGLQEAFYGLSNHYRHRDGHRVTTESTGLPIKDAGGKVLKWRGADRDITARKHFEDALVDSEKRKRLIFETAFNAIVIMDAYGLVGDWNPHAEKMFGWTRAEALGRPVAELIIPPRYREAHYLGLQRFLHGGQGPIMNRLIELTALRRDGSEFPVEFSVAPLKLGNAYEFSAFIHDISQRKETERKIRAAQVDLAVARNEIDIAQRIQASLLPSAPLCGEGFEIAGLCLPAAQVGGDYFDYFYRDGGHVDLVIADVSGHAVGPALLMAETRTALRAQAQWAGGPAQMLAALNGLLFDDLDRAELFVTMAYLQYSIADAQLAVANAGHPPPLLLRRQTGRCLALDADGLVLGIRKQVAFAETTVDLQPGDRLLLYTDGLLETQNGSGEFFGSERAEALFASLAELSPQQAIAALLAELKRFRGRESFDDDVTLLVFARC